MTELRDIWIGKEEYGGEAPAPRDGTTPAPHWRLDAIAATRRPRSLTISPDGRRLVFVEDGETSDTWLMDLEERVPIQLTTGHPPTPYWEDATPRLSPDGSRVVYVEGDRAWLVPTGGGPPVAVVEVADIAWGGPRWLSEGRLVVMREEGASTRLELVDIDDARPRRLVSDFGDLDNEGDETEPCVTPDGTRVAYTFTPRADLNRSEIRVVHVG